MAFNVREDATNVNPSSPGEHQTINPGETVEITAHADMANTSIIDGPVPVYVTGSAVQGGPKRIGTIDPTGGYQTWHYTPTQPGEIIVTRFRDSTRQEPHAVVEPGSGSGGRQNQVGWDPGAEEAGNTHPETIDPSNYGMIVNADTPSGIALSASAVRRGVTADAGGTEVNLSDGTTVTAYPRQEADEAIRDTETGDPISSPVGSGGVEGGVGSGSSSGGSGSGGGLIGGAVAVVVLLIAGAAALLGGDDGGD